MSERSTHTAAKRSQSLTGSVDLPFPEYRTPPTDPVDLLHRWLFAAQLHGVREATALALATADSNGRTSIRTVVLHHLTLRGLVFTTHAGSRKGGDLRARPWASGLLYWRETSQQISIDGPVQQLGDDDTDRFWAERPVFTHAMTTASRQSESLRDVDELRARARALTRAGPQPRPPSYVAFEVIAQSLEFWSDGRDRLHERLRYERAGDGWTWTRLQP